MFDKNELCILLRSLELFRDVTMTSCIQCDSVDYYKDYAKTKYCVQFCSVCKEVEKIDSIIFKIREVLK